MIGTHLDLFESEGARAFRQRVRIWFTEHLPERWGTNHFPEFPTEEAEVAFLRSWQKKLSDHGLAGLSWPEEYGGGGASLIEQAIFVEERDRARAPIDIGIVGTQMVGPMLIAHGSEAQKNRYLAKILTGEELWCQGFSEPEAGSDLAALSTKAVPSGSGWALSGQKVWTSRAQYAEQMIVLARTDPAASAHRGITAFIVPMDAPGLTIQAIRQINGSTEFCEVFLDDVQVPDTAVVGAVNEGWSVAITTLSFERLATTRAFEMRRLIADLVGEHAARTPGSALDASLLQHVADAHVAGVTFSRMVSGVAGSGAPGADASVTKLATTELGQRIVSSALSLAPDIVMGGRVKPAVGRSVSWCLEYTNGLKNTIAAGTSQIQRNIIGERILGLPRPGRRVSPVATPRPFTDPLVSPEEQEFLSTVRQALSKQLTTEAVVESAEHRSPTSPELWKLLVDLGVTGIGVDDDTGGLSLLARVVSEGGYALAPGSLLAHAIAARSIAVNGADGELLERLAKGQLRCGVPVARDHGSLLTVDDGRVSGSFEALELTPDDAVVIELPDGTGARIAFILLGQAGVSITSCETYDPTRNVVTITLDKAELQTVAQVDRAGHESLVRQRALLVAADSTGSARRSVEEAVAYASEREQFGELIGSFQSIKHMIVDAHVAVTGAEAALADALASIDHARRAARFSAHIASAAAIQAHVKAAATTIQVFGGIGFTREVTAHLHLKRARVNEFLCETPSTHLTAAAVDIDAVLTGWSTDYSIPGSRQPNS